MTDLNERVQARIGDLYEEIRCGADDLLFRTLREYPDRLRERWERHYPSKESFEIAERRVKRLGSKVIVQVECDWCSNDCGDPYLENPRNWPCPDALAVLREIGVEP